MVYVELAVEEKFELFEEPRHRIVRERSSEVIFLPGIRQSVAYKEILKLFLFFQFREVNRITDL